MYFWFEVATVLFAVLAAIFWFYSAIVRAPYKDIVLETGVVDAAIISNGDDVIRTIQKQSFWSAWAAFAAGAAAGCQAISLVFKTFA